MCALWLLKKYKNCQCHNTVAKRHVCRLQLSSLQCSSAMHCRGACQRCEKSLWNFRALFGPAVGNKARLCNSSLQLRCDKRIHLSHIHKCPPAAQPYKPFAIRWLLTGRMSIEIGQNNKLTASSNILQLLHKVCESACTLTSGVSPWQSAAGQNMHRVSLTPFLT